MQGLHGGHLTPRRATGIDPAVADGALPIASERRPRGMSIPPLRALLPYAETLLIAAADGSYGGA